MSWAITPLTIDTTATTEAPAALIPPGRPVYTIRVEQLPPGAVIGLQLGSGQLRTISAPGSYELPTAAIDGVNAQVLTAAPGSAQLVAYHEPVIDRPGTGGDGYGAAISAKLGTIIVLLGAGLPAALVSGLLNVNVGGFTTALPAGQQHLGRVTVDTFSGALTIDTLVTGHVTVDSILRPLPIGQNHLGRLTLDSIAGFVPTFSTGGGTNPHLNVTICATGSAVCAGMGKQSAGSSFPVGLDTIYPSMSHIGRVTLDSITATQSLPVHLTSTQAAESLATGMHHIGTVAVDSIAGRIPQIDSLGTLQLGNGWRLQVEPCVAVSPVRCSGQQPMGGSFPVAIASDQSRVRVADSGTVSFAHLGRVAVDSFLTLPSLGQRTSASSIPVVIANDQSLFSVTLGPAPAGTLIGDVQVDTVKSRVRATTDTVHFLGTPVCGPPSGLGVLCVGQQGMSGSISVAIANNQSAVPIVPSNPNAHLGAVAIDSVGPNTGGRQAITPLAGAAGGAAFGIPTYSVLSGFFSAYTSTSPTSIGNGRALVTTSTTANQVCVTDSGAGSSVQTLYITEAIISVRPTTLSNAGSILGTATVRPMSGGAPVGPTFAFVQFTNPTNESVNTIVIPFTPPLSGNFTTTTGIGIWVTPASTTSMTWACSLAGYHF